MKLAFILLVQVYGSSFTNHRVFIQEAGATDEWGCTRFEGDIESTDTCHYKAILFETRAQLDAWLRSHDASGDKLVDVHTGAVRTLKSHAVYRTVSRPAQEVDHYEMEAGR